VALAALLLAPCAGSPRAESDPFSTRFVDATLRIDLYHHGHAREESVTVDRLVRETPWSGSTTVLSDPSPVGSYRVEMTDAHDGTHLFATSFDSLFTEYRTTQPALGGVPRTYHEALRVPFPRRPVQIALIARHVGQDPRRLLQLEFDPARDRVAGEPPPGRVEIIPVHEGADPHATVDIVFLGEGYDDGDRFRAQLHRAADLLLSHEPYASLRHLLTVTGVRPVSRDRGCDEPSHGVWRDTPFDASFDAFGSPRYLLTENTRALRDVAAHVPYDTLVVMVDHDRYGGGGIYGQYCIFTADNPWAGYLLLHEFGHSFGGLGDEYYASGVAYTDLHPPGHEPPQPNLTALLDPSALKWRDLVADNVPLPTPWNKAAFDATESAWQTRRRDLQTDIAEARRRGAPASVVEDLETQLEHGARERAEISARQLASEPYAHRVGAFEGAGYASTGLYRPAVDCLMFTRGEKPLCPVCRRAVADRIRAVAGSPPGGHPVASIRSETGGMEPTVPTVSPPVLQSGRSSPDADPVENAP
jgi:hypothetical protein